MAGPMDKDRPESRGGSGGVEEPREVLDECVLQKFKVNAVSDWKSVTRDAIEGRQGRTRGASWGSNCSAHFSNQCGGRVQKVQCVEDH